MPHTPTAERGGHNHHKTTRYQPNRHNPPAQHFAATHWWTFEPQAKRNLKVVRRVGNQPQSCRVGMERLEHRTEREEECLMKLVLLKEGLMQDLLTGRVRVPASMLSKGEDANAARH